MGPGWENKMETGIMMKMVQWMVWVLGYGVKKNVRNTEEITMSNGIQHEDEY